MSAIHWLWALSCSAIKEKGSRLGRLIEGFDCATTLFTNPNSTDQEMHWNEGNLPTALLSSLPPSTSSPVPLQHLHRREETRTGSARGNDEQFPLCWPFNPLDQYLEVLSTLSHPSPLPVNRHKHAWPSPSPSLSTAISELHTYALQAKRHVAQPKLTPWLVQQLNPKHCTRWQSLISNRTTWVHIDHVSAWACPDPRNPWSEFKLQTGARTAWTDGVTKQVALSESSNQAVADLPITSGGAAAPATAARRSPQLPHAAPVPHLKFWVSSATATKWTQGVM
jgi:hypothetical protein